ncbi:MAG: 50S ribosomal protein L1 [Armatimonadota bacterium]|nr:MAG: 50S ribosomal protein L1 [Armatimonadota bacterium]
MAKHGKTYVEVAKTIDRDRLYTAQEAIELVCNGHRTKFDEAIDIAVRLGVDPRHGEQMVRGTVVLPHGTGKSPRIAAFAKGERATEAETAGADVVGAEDLVQRIEGGWKDFDVLVATRDMMSMVGRLGKRLGPRMPNPKAGTLSDEIGKTIQELKSGKLEFRMDKAGVIHAPLGKLSFGPERLKENLATFIAALLRARPPAAKGQFLRKITISSTMGPGVHVDPADAAGVAAATE